MYDVQVIKVVKVVVKVVKVVVMRRQKCQVSRRWRCTSVRRSWPAAAGINN